MSIGRVVRELAPGSYHAQGLKEGQGHMSSNHGNTDLDFFRSQGIKVTRRRWEGIPGK